MWLKFVEFAKSHILPKFVHPKPNLVDIICQTLCRQIDGYAVLPNFSHTKHLSFTVQIKSRKHTLEKKWNFLLKHTSGNVQEISNEIYCSNTIPRKYHLSGSFPGFYGNLRFHLLFLTPGHMKFPEITENFICLCISQLKDM